jgi:hypothetical protein
MQLYRVTDGGDPVAALGRPGLGEVATIPLLLLGSVLFGVGWFAGLVLLWWSPLGEPATSFWARWSFLGAPVRADLLRCSAYQ